MNANADPDTDLIDSSSGPLSDQSCSPSEPERPVILLVDDQAPNRALLRAYLSSSYALREAVDGASALELLTRERVDLVLLDVMMPHMSGFAVCRRIKQTADRRYLPVILLTALGQQEDRNTGLAAGADDFLTKPVDREELLLRVQTFIKLSRQDARLRRQLDELGQQDRLIRHQLAELQAVDSLKDELVSLMVHDLRNPLGGISGFLGSLKNSVDDQGLRADAHLALENSDRLRETLDDILQVRLLESGTVHINPELIEADAVVRDAIASVSGAARARQVEISPTIEVVDAHLVADKKLVRRAIENLLTNALKFSPAGGIVSAAVRQVGDDIEIEVADRGTGISDAVKDQLFRKFGSAETVRGDSRQGIGLGLYLVKLVAAAHGGRAEVRDREGGGTTFGLYLPRRETATA
jgi:two-component system sensor histidine kinase/response regulator